MLRETGGHEVATATPGRKVARSPVALLSPADLRWTRLSRT
jgi:hypothetical protein